MLFVTARLCVYSFRRRFMPNLASLQQATSIAFFSSNSNHPEENSIVFFRAKNVGKRIAVVDTKRSYTYDCLLRISDIIGEDILKRTHKMDLSGCCISFLCPNNILYVATQWAIWRNGGIAVPLCSSHPNNMLRYVIEDCGANMVVSSSEYSTQMESLAKATGVEIMVVDEATVDQVVVGEVSTGSKLTAIERTEDNWNKRDAMIIYTSGTTGPPKGVLSTHGNLRSQVSSLVEAWGWTENDYIIHCLPLHHVHGVVNVLMCALWVGATCHMLPKFSPQPVWDILTGKNPQPSLFMAVPTIYSKLIQHFDESNYNEVEKDAIRKKCQELRLMVSGSSALPEPVMKRWQEITGHTLLERYGMTEIGMALSNPLNGSRLPGCVGTPLPGTEVRIVAQNEDGTSEVLVKGNEHGSKVASDKEGKEGELQVRGPSVFKCYWNKPEATSESFTKDGWFKTGDTAAFKDGVYSILGRTSVDIIKSGGYKISALDVERHLLSHDYIVDCAVVGKPDPVWGERVAAIVAVHQGKALSLEDLRQWARGRMTPYQTPSVLLVVDELPRNTMGKVNKKELLKLYLDQL